MRRMEKLYVQIDRSVEVLCSKSVAKNGELTMMLGLERKSREMGQDQIWNLSSVIGQREEQQKDNEILCHTAPHYNGEVESLPKDVAKRKSTVQGLDKLTSAFPVLKGIADFIYLANELIKPCSTVPMIPYQGPHNEMTDLNRSRTGKHSTINRGLVTGYHVVKDGTRQKRRQDDSQ